MVFLLPSSGLQLSVILYVQYYSDLFLFFSFSTSRRAVYEAESHEIREKTAFLVPICYYAICICIVGKGPVREHNKRIYYYNY